MTDATTATAAPAIDSAAPATGSVFSKIVGAVESAVGLGPSAPEATNVVQMQPQIPTGAPSLPALHLETAVQMACMHMHGEKADPSGVRLVAMCGEYMIAELATAGINADTLAKWACAEVRRRSSSADISEVQAARIA